MIAKILRVYSYLYHLALSLFLLGISIVALSTDTTLHLRMLPASGRQEILLLWGGLIGLVTIMLAITGWFRPVFPLWTLAVFVLMLYRYFYKPYVFSGRDEFNFALWLSAGALLAFLASLTLLRRREKTR
ncbi:MAG: hypothetical protein HYZ57_12145 [Acidobacteria bacterium]|nr:hypothetical protein [Acidobacteriota bacterium]